jgi:glycosyltransferase involved in cell wall biosynthesis
LEIGKRPGPLYSICITCRNSVHTIERSLESVLSQLDDRFEVVVVDGGSTDGTMEVLERFRRKYGNVTIISQPCSRGRGRDIAYKHARGKYLIQGADADLIFQPTLRSILEYYHEGENSFGNYALRISFAFLICTKALMDKVDGWPDLQQHEDLFLFTKLPRFCKYESNYSLEKMAVRKHAKARRTIIREALENYTYWRDWHRTLPLSLAMDVLTIGHLADKNVSLPRKLAHVVIFTLGSVAQYTKARNKLSREDLKYFIMDLRHFMSLKLTETNIDLIFDRTVEPRRILSRHSSLSPSASNRW